MYLLYLASENIVLYSYVYYNTSMLKISRIHLFFSISYKSLSSNMHLSPYMYFRILKYLKMTITIKANKFSSNNVPSNIQNKLFRFPFEVPSFCMSSFGFAMIVSAKTVLFAEKNGIKVIYFVTY